MSRSDMIIYDIDSQMITFSLLPTVYAENGFNIRHKMILKTD
jgi:hypothetical protein